MLRRGWHPRRGQCTLKCRLAGTQQWEKAEEAGAAVRRQCGGPGQPHRLHVHAFDCLTPLLNCCLARGDLLGACDHLAAIVSAMDTLLGAALTHGELEQAAAGRLRVGSRS